MLIFVWVICFVSAVLTDEMNNIKPFVNPEVQSEIPDNIPEYYYNNLNQASLADGNTENTAVLPLNFDENNVVGQSSKCKNTDMLLKIMNNILQVLVESDKHIDTPTITKVNNELDIIKKYIEESPDNLGHDELYGKFKGLEEQLQTFKDNTERQGSPYETKRNMDAQVVFKYEFPSQQQTCREAFLKLIEIANRAYMQLTEHPICKTSVINQYGAPIAYQNQFYPNYVQNPNDIGVNTINQGITPYENIQSYQNVQTVWTSPNNLQQQINPAALNQNPSSSLHSHGVNTNIISDQYLQKYTFPGTNNFLYTTKIPPTVTNFPNIVTEMSNTVYPKNSRNLLSYMTNQDDFDSNLEHARVVAEKIIHGLPLNVNSNIASNDLNVVPSQNPENSVVPVKYSPQKLAIDKRSNQIRLDGIPINNDNSMYSQEPINDVKSPSMDSVFNVNIISQNNNGVTMPVQPNVPNSQQNNIEILPRDIEKDLTKELHNIMDMANDNDKLMTNANQQSGVDLQGIQGKEAKLPLSIFLQQQFPIHQQNMPPPDSRNNFSYQQQNVNNGQQQGNQPPASNNPMINLPIGPSNNVPNEQNNNPAQQQNVDNSGNMLVLPETNERPALINAYPGQNNQIQFHNEQQNDGNQFKPHPHINGQNDFPNQQQNENSGNSGSSYIQNPDNTGVPSYVQNHMPLHQRLGNLNKVRNKITNLQQSIGTLNLQSSPFQGFPKTFANINQAYHHHPLPNDLHFKPNHGMFNQGRLQPFDRFHSFQGAPKRSADLITRNHQNSIQMSNFQVTGTHYPGQDTEQNLPLYYQNFNQHANVGNAQNLPNNQNQYRPENIETPNGPHDGQQNVETENFKQQMYQNLLQNQIQQRFPYYPQNSGISNGLPCYQQQCRDLLNYRLQNVYKQYPQQNINGNPLNYGNSINLAVNNGMPNVDQWFTMTNLYKLNALADTNGIIEITYLLKRPEPVVFQPYYVVKYRLPYNVFLTQLKDLLLRKPYLRYNPVKMYQELIPQSNITAISPDLKKYNENDITSLVARSGAYVKANVVNQNDTFLDEQLRIIQNLNSDVGFDEAIKTIDHLITLNNNTESVLENLIENDNNDLNNAIVSKDFKNQVNQTNEVTKPRNPLLFRGQNLTEVDKYPATKSPHGYRDYPPEPNAINQPVSLHNLNKNLQLNNPRLVPAIAQYQQVNRIPGEYRTPLAT